jgi:hypothetical protein
MDDHMKDFQKIPHIPVPIIERQHSCLTILPNNFYQGFQISIMKSFAPPPSLRVGLHDIPHSPLICTMSYSTNCWGVFM